MSVPISENEKIVLEIRKHWIVLFEGVVSLAVFFIIFIFVIILGLGSFISDEKVLKVALVVLPAAMGLITWTLAFFVWVNYYLDIWVLTDKRVLDIEQHSLFSRDISEFRLDKVQDITVEVKGIVATFLGYGDIHVQTAGKSREFIIRKITNPYNARDFIAREVDRIIDEQDEFRRI